MSGRWTRSDRAARLPPDWPATRRRILRRDRETCHICGQPGADEVDHITAGDDHHDSNLAAIHAHPCHARKSAAEGVAARTRITASRRRPPEAHPGVRSTS